MKLATFFKTRSGTGFLSTADKGGKPDIAIYAKPHVIGTREIALIMRNHLSYKNIMANPKAAYLFLEDKPGHKGIRLYLTRIGVEKDREKVLSMRKRTTPLTKGEALTLVYFRVDKCRELAGSKEYVIG